MQLKNTGISIFSQLTNLLEQLTVDQYIAPIDLLNGNTIGKHVRHIVEFFIILENGYKTGVINYDSRPHDTLFETNIELTLARIDELADEIKIMILEKQAILEVSYVTDALESVKIPSTLQRELAYNIEHAIHHMAIIKIAVKTVFPMISIPPNFGIAFSTLRYHGASLQ